MLCSIALTTDTPSLLVTARDLEILASLDRTPLTAQQLLKLSQIFARPFTSDKTLRERLLALESGGWVKSARYAVESAGASPKYYYLTRIGFAILHGEEVLPPTKRLFTPIGIAHQHHTRALADFLVHTLVAAKDAGVQFTCFYRENTLCLQVGTECVYPDSSFQLITSDLREWNFFVELDNHSHSVRSDRDRESWERKLRLYSSLQEKSPSRFRVLVVTTRSGDRLRHILETAAEIGPHRPLVYAVSLTDYLAVPQALTTSCFLDHRQERVSLLPRVCEPSSRDAVLARRSTAC